MKYIVAYALLVLGGKKYPEAADILHVLKEAGTTVDMAKIESLCRAFKGKRFH